MIHISALDSKSNKLT